MRTVQATKIFLAPVQMKMLTFSHSQFYNAAKTEQKNFTQEYIALRINQLHKHGRHN